MTVQDSDLDKATMDWFLPLAHEQALWKQFMQGGRTFLDVGAHVGTWVLNIGHRFERVYCFEPDPRGYEALQHNLDKVGMKHVEVIPKAVGRRAGKLTLTRYPNPCTNTFYPGETRREDSHTDKLDVDVVSLDEFCDERGITDVDFVKLDVEAAELLVLQGAQKMWRKCRPDFLIELHGRFDRQARELLDFEAVDIVAGGYGYSAVRHRDKWEFGDTHHRIFQPGEVPTDQELVALGHPAWWLNITGVME